MTTLQRFAQTTSNTPFIEKDLFKFALSKPTQTFIKTPSTSKNDQGWSLC